MNGVRSISMRKGYLLTALAAAVLLAASSGTAQAQGMDQNQEFVLSELKIELSGPRVVVEGQDATITVRGSAMVAPTVKREDVADDASGDDANWNDGDSSGNRRVTVNLRLDEGMSSSATMAEFDDSGQVDDADIISNPAVALIFAENTGSSPRMRTVTGSITVRTNHDTDAEDERVDVALDKDPDASDDTGFDLPERDDTSLTDFAVPMGDNLDLVGFTIDDDETQTYVLTLGTAHTATTPPTEGGEISLDIAAKPAHHQDGETITLQLSRSGGRTTGYGIDADDDGDTVFVGVIQPEAPATEDDGEIAGPTQNKRPIVITTDENDGNRVTDMLTLTAYSGDAGDDNLEASFDVDVLDVHMLPEADGITAVAKDEDGTEVTEMMEGAEDPVFLTITVDRGRGASDRITDEELTVEIRPADPGQLADYELSESRITLESRSSGKQTNDIDTKIELSARSDQDVGMEYLVLNFVVSGDSDFGTDTSTGTFSIGIVDNTAKKVAPKAEADAYPAIRAALGTDPETTVMNPGETGTIMTSDLFDVMDGYTANYKVSVAGGAVSVSASSDTVTVNAMETGTAKVTVTATAEMAGSSFLPEQTVSDVASITFEVMVEEGMTEPVPALPLVAQLLLALFMMAGGARLYRRRQG